MSDIALQEPATETAPAAQDALTSLPSPVETPTPDTQPEMVADAPASVVPQPFTFRSRGQEFTLDGAMFEPGKGLTIAETALQQHRQMLARAKEWEIYGRPELERSQRELARLRQQRSETESVADKAMEFLREQLLKPDLTDEQVFVAALTLRDRLPQLELEARKAFLDQREQQLTAGSHPDPQQFHAQAAQAAHGMMLDLVDEVRLKLPALPDAARDELVTELRDDWQRYVQVITTDHGPTPVFDDVAFERDLSRLWAREAKLVETTQRVTAATQANAAQATPVGRAAPPTPRAAATAPRATGATRPKTKAEWDRWVAE
jgi:hypothetical protein